MVELFGPNVYSILANTLLIVGIVVLVIGLTKLHTSFVFISVLTTGQFLYTVQNTVQHQSQFLLHSTWISYFAIMAVYVLTRMKSMHGR